MAEFCTECIKELFGEELESDFKGIISKEQYERGQILSVICEGCGCIYVNHLGDKLSEECLENLEMSKEEEFLKQIISSCELILDDMDQGGKISQANFNMLGYCDGIMFRMQQELSRQLKPSHYKEAVDENEVD